MWRIKHFCEPLLYNNHKPWKKKDTNSCFDVAMGSCDGAEICEIVGFKNVFKNVGERCTAKNYYPVSLLALISKVFQTLVSNRVLNLTFF